ncbi:tectonic-1 isoform X2 [Thamnophis elegans]|uniref:tectonic-1 isoform X2 n=1 Tax=Thamnophis elegans TaxID=35005 RepID=UPI001377AD22|nr:tectonic-1 isoform X2 [Thamnophis elegans]
MRRRGGPPLLLRRAVLFLLLLPGVCPSTAGPTSEAPSSKPATTPGGATAAWSTTTTTEPAPLSPHSQAMSTAGPVEASSPRRASPQTPSHVGPWPAPVTKVAELCVCDLLENQCDVNCCCDPVCTAADFSVFTACSVPVVTGDRHFCRQPEALYSIDQSAQPPERIFQLVEKVNPSVFCLQTSNYKAGLSFQAPEIPTLQNFDRLLQEFDRGSFATGQDLVPEAEPGTPREAGANDTSRYKFKDLIQTTDGFLRLPAPLFSHCAHENPAGFLMTQAEKCNTAMKMDGCTALPELSMLFYTNFSILVVPNSSQTVNVTIQSITIQVPEGLRSRLASADAVLLPALNNQSCSNVVLEASYLVTFTEAGEIVGATVSLVLGTVHTSVVFLQQMFAIRFIQQDTRPVPFSGSPGYLTGLPIRAGFRSIGSGVIQSLNERSQLTMMKSTPAQDCFRAEGSRTPILFGYDTVSGCKVRILGSAECTLLAPEILRVLKGQNFPDYVASFGDSLPQNGPDWVQISYNSTKPATCEIPVSFEVQVKWTKYGSLVNPQAKIESVTVTVEPGSESIMEIFSSVSFVDISAPAQPGYKAWPTIEAHLPFDFFFPFV